MFREFWLERPPPDAKQMALYALLDSPSVAGAYRFVVKPGAPTDVDVTAQSMFRSEVAKRRRGAADQHVLPRHDHAVLRRRFQAGDTRLGRPADSRRQRRAPVAAAEQSAAARLSDFRIEHPRGFGLLQRERNFDRYQDLEADYQRRPSAWVEPVGDWGTGTVNWSNSDRPDTTTISSPSGCRPSRSTAGSERTFEYRLTFRDDPEAGLSGGLVSTTRIGAGNGRPFRPTQVRGRFCRGKLARCPKRP